MAAKLTEFGDQPQAGVYSSTLDEIVGDIHNVHIILNSVNGHGKTSSLRTIIKHLKKSEPGIIIKIFDISQAWFHRAPVEHRQRVTAATLNRGAVVNEGDTVYEMGSLTKDQRRAFVASVIKLDYQTRYETGLRFGIDAIKGLPFIIYVFEEASCYFDSWSITMRKNDPWSSILYDFVMVGRNYKLRAFLVVSSEQGELCPKIRRRSTRLLGRIESKEDLSYYRGKDPRLAEVVKSMEKYHFIYWNGNGFGPFRIKDLVKSVPVDYVLPFVDEEKVEEVRPPGYWSRFFMGLGVGVVLWLLVSHFWRLYS